MIEISIPGHGQLSLEVLVLDYNGTLALDGLVPIHVQEIITTLAKLLEIHIITSDTFGSVAVQCKELPVQINILETKNHAQEKADYLNQFGERMVVAIGNGANDKLMLKKAHLGIVVLGTEGCSSLALIAADVIVKDIKDALELLINSQRLIATLRC
ncbi:MAG: HAD family hydrolase [Desulfitobacteriaceae bacterium]